MKKKTWLIAGLAALCLAALVFVLQCSAYRVQADDRNLAYEVNLWLNRDADGTSPSPQYRVTIYNSIDFGAERYVLMEVNGQLGEIHLVRGLNGKFKIAGTSYGSGNFRDRIVEQSGRTYLLFGGRNAVFGIDRMLFTLGGKEYSLTIPKTSPFFLSVELDAPVEDSRLDLNTVRFVDQSGADITRQVPW